MSYTGDFHRALSGSLSLLAPGDKTAEQNAIELLNWRVDTDGSLRSRAGMQVVQSGFPGPVDAIGRRGSSYYFGVGGSLYRLGTASPVATAGDGLNPFTFAAMNGFMWVMDRGVQGRDDGWGIFYKWLPDPPAISATPAQGYLLASGATGPSGTYVYYVTFLSSGIETNPGPASAPFDLE